MVDLDPKLEQLVQLYEAKRELEAQLRTVSGNLKELKEEVHEHLSTHKLQRLGTADGYTIYCRTERSVRTNPERKRELVEALLADEELAYMVAPQSAAFRSFCIQSIEETGELPEIAKERAYVAEYNTVGIQRG